MAEFSSHDVQQWVDDYGDTLFQYAVTRLRNHGAAEDAVQETYLAALRGIDGFSQHSSVRTWLIGILKHKIVDHMRRDARKAEVNPAASDDSLDDLFNVVGHYKAAPSEWSGDPQRDFKRTEFWDCFHCCLGKMPERLASVFVLRHLEGLGTDEICKVLEITPTNLWVMLHRGRLALRECLALNWFCEDDKRSLNVYVQENCTTDSAVRR
jgi:RNA polymerase sigma-70 factor (ECF subfamily)